MAQSTYTFANATTNYASAASQAKFESITSLFKKYRLKGTAFTNVPSYGIRTLFEMTDRYGLELQIYNDGDVSQYKIYVYDTNDGTSGVLLSIATASVSAGSYYVLYVGMQSGAGGFVAELFDAGGSSLASGSATGHTIGNGGAGNGQIRFGNNGTNAHSWEIDGVAFYSAALAGAARASVPASGDANIIGLWKFDEGTGTSVADDTGGTALTISGTGTWNTATGAWDGAGGGGGATRRRRQTFVTPRKPNAPKFKGASLFQGPTRIPAPVAAARVPVAIIQFARKLIPTPTQRAKKQVMIVRRPRFMTGTSTPAAGNIPKHKFWWFRRRHR